MFNSGQRICITVAEGRKFTFTIHRSFEPFTKSVVLLALCQDISPDPVIVKIYDPRFLDDRVSPVPSQPSRPWTLAAEKAAALSPHPDFHVDWLYEDEPDADDMDGQAQRAALWEEHYLRLSNGCFEAERGAHEHLSDLQGSVIPRLLCTGVFVPPDERAIQPSAIVIEYIPDAITLDQVSLDALDRDLCIALVRAVDSFPAHGVYHADIHPKNVIFSPRQRPVRAVIIDFGNAGVKSEGEDEDQWQFNVAFASDSRRLRQLLRGKGLLIPDQEGPGTTAE